MLFLYPLVFLTLVVFLTYVYTSRNVNYWKKRNVFFLQPKPFFGNFFNVWFLRENVGEWLQDVYNSTKKHPYVGIWAFGTPYLVVKSPTLTKNILLKDFAHFENRLLVAPKHDELLSNMMFFVKNPQWKKIRSKVSPVFTSSKLKIMFSLIQSEAQEFVKYLNKHPLAEAKYICQTYATNVISNCAFGINAHAFEDEKSEFRRMSNNVFDLRLITTYRQLASWFWPEIVHAFNIEGFDRWIRVRMETILSEVLCLRAQSPNSKPKDLIDLYIKIQETQSNEEMFNEVKMIAQAIQFFTAAYETISTISSFLLYELAQRKDVQERLRQEIADAVGQDGELTYEAINNMKYLEMCFLETIRKYPVVPFLERTCTANYKVEETGLLIEKGTGILIPMLGLHRDPEYFPDPMTWNPERFENKNTVNQDGFTFLPFGEGPRICIGARFGKLVVQLGIASILQNFRVELMPETPVPQVNFIKSTIFLVSQGGLPLKFVHLETSDTVKDL